MKRLIFLILISCFLLSSQEKLSLNECIKIALENNIKLLIQKGKIESSYYQAEIAKKYSLPTFSTSFNYTYLGNNKGVSIGNFPPMKLMEDNIFTLKFSVNYPVYTGKKIEKSYEISKENLEKEKIEYENEVLNLIFEIHKAYFSILKMKKICDTSLSYKELLEKHLLDARKMFESGITTKLDILNTEVQLKNAETKIIECENLLKLAKSNLNFLINKPIDYDFDIYEEIIDISEEEKNLKWWIDTGLRERKEIMMMEKLLLIYEKNVEIEKSSLYPQVFFFLNFNIEKGTQNSREDWGNNWNTGILISYDIWNWGQTKDKIKKAIIEKEQIKNQLELLKKSIELEIKSAYLNFISVKEKINEIKKQIEKSEENLRVAKLLYQEGLATNTDVLNAITSLTEAKNNYYTYLYDYRISYLQLQKSSGLLKWEEE